MAKTGKERQQAYRKRMLDKGYRQFAFWLDRETQAALKALEHVVDDLSTVASQAIKYYHDYRISKTVSSNVKPVSSNVSSNNRTVSRNVTSNRYMPQDLEDHILELRQAGMALREISSKAEKRARQRRG